MVQKAKPRAKGSRSSMFVDAAAFRAWRKAASENAPEPRTPGLGARPRLSLLESSPSYPGISGICLSLPSIEITERSRVGSLGSGWNRGGKGREFDEFRTSRRPDLPLIRCCATTRPLETAVAHGNVLFRQFPKPVQESLFALDYVSHFTRRPFASHRLRKILQELSLRTISHAAKVLPLPVPATVGSPRQGRRP